MLIKRTSAEIINEAMDKIAENTPITNFHAGAIARAIVEAMGPEYESLYDFAIDVYKNGTLRHAKDEYLDLIGELFNYPRRTDRVFDKEKNEFVEVLIDNETYRYELSQRVHTIVSSNEEALRLACLTIPGVQNIIGKEYTHGTGSFSFIVVTQYGFDAEEVRAEVEAAVMKTKAFGIRPNVMLPVTVPIEMKLQLLFHESVSDIDREQIRFQVKSELYNYFGNFGLGKAFIYNDFVRQVMNVDSKIVDFEVLQLYLNHEPVLLTNHTILEEERIQPELIEVV
ncbi:hypothetical protein [Parageobacillus galactosidasius]|uniref:Baseplate protein J-like domain-containing protein n=1 Tax=Parageobacillus galactosidasius TaxID=883812 RepID=A0A226QRT9_9BACL|nr:hypothetical protein [Parageobacillus galactosidasius]OXB94744.1 hypothetical protein B9L23_07725 [Parageobacillus galactosidasius]